MLSSEQYSFEETWQGWQAVDDTRSNLTSLEIKPESFRTGSAVLATGPCDRLQCQNNVLPEPGSKRVWPLLICDLILRIIRICSTIRYLNELVQTAPGFIACDR